MFIHTLPLFFSHIQLASPVELLVILAAVFILVFLTLPAHESNYNTGFPDDYLFSAWNGSVRLSWVFWPFFLILNASLYAADILAKSGIFTVSGWDDVHFVMLFPISWWAISVWRCTKNGIVRVWRACARLAILLVFFEYALKLSIRIDYPRVFFACEELLLDYGNCF